jgi:multiple antibiotic resistance protein
MLPDGRMPFDPAPLVRSVFVTIAALLPIVNPLGSAPIFLSMSADLPPVSRKTLSLAVARNAFVLLAASMLVGSHVLAFFGISLPIVRVGGGLLVTANGWRMLNADHAPSGDAPKLTSAWEREVARRAFFPLTFPLTVGPGSVSVAITLGARVPGPLTSAAIDVLIDLIGCAIVALVVFLSYRFASKLIRLLGETGTQVFTRLSSFILLCVGVGIIWSGIEGLVGPMIK